MTKGQMELQEAMDKDPLNIAKINAEKRDAEEKIAEVLDTFMNHYWAYIFFEYVETKPVMNGQTGEMKIHVELKVRLR